MAAFLRTRDDLLMCNACGTQCPATISSGKKTCRICDDPRQFVPQTGQAFTNLEELRINGHRNVWWQDEVNKDVSEPQFAIGERAMLLQTPFGNVLWDLIPFLDRETVDKVNSLGGIKAIVISHPHYYGTYADWAITFHCPVYIGAPDKGWLERLETPDLNVCFLDQLYTPISEVEGSGLTAILAGGHFPGSLLFHWDQKLFLADTIVTVPSATNPEPGKPGVISFTFFWSIPYMIPLVPRDILAIWKAVKPFQFHTAFGAFRGMDVRTVEGEAMRGTGGVKGRLLESCKIFVMGEGWEDHLLFKETV